MMFFKVDGPMRRWWQTFTAIQILLLMSKLKVGEDWPVCLSYFYALISQRDNRQIPRRMHKWFEWAAVSELGNIVTMPEVPTQKWMSFSQYDALWRDVYEWSGLAQRVMEHSMIGIRLIHRIWSGTESERSLWVHLRLNTFPSALRSPHIRILHTVQFPWE